MSWAMTVAARGGPWRAVGAAFGILLLVGCSSLPVIDRAPITSEAIPLSKTTTLGRIASSYRPVEDHSGFRQIGRASCRERV